MSQGYTLPFPGLRLVVDGQQVNDFKLFFPGRCGHFDFVADFAIEQGFSDGRRRGD